MCIREQTARGIRKNATLMDQSIQTQIIANTIFAHRSKIRNLTFAFATTAGLSSLPMGKDKLGQAQKEAFGSLLVAHARLTKAIDAELTEVNLPTLEVYDVLLALEDAPGRKLTMSDLAEAVVFSRSGLTRLIDRLEAQGYVCREAHPKDRRSLYAVLTEKGLQTRKDAWQPYSEMIHRHFGRFVTNEEAHTMRSALKRAISEHVTSDQALREVSITGKPQNKKPSG